MHTIKKNITGYSLQVPLLKVKCSGWFIDIYGDHKKVLIYLYSKIIMSIYLQL